VKPVPETAEVLRDMTENHQEGLALALLGAARRAEAIVPECVGMSVGLVPDGLTFTLVAEEPAASGPGAVQDPGPETAHGVEERAGDVAGADLFDEERWLLQAQAGAARGVASTLSLPILDDEEVVGSVSLYASTPGAFEGRHEALAEALGASAEAVVRNADLSFDTRRLAAESAPRRRDAADVEVAVGVLMGLHGLDAGAARARLRASAERAGITEAEAARVISGIEGD